LLEVLPEYQRQGVGKNLLERMLKDLETYYMVDLTCDEAMISFYEKHGLRKLQAMGIRKHQFQSGHSNT